MRHGPHASQMKLLIQPLGLCVPIQTGQTLLQGAEAAGVELPNSCRNGTCRACMALLTQGRVNYRIDWTGLSAEEKSAGWVLPCVAVPEGDVTLFQPEAQPEACVGGTA